MLWLKYSGSTEGMRMGERLLVHSANHLIAPILHGKTAKTARFIWHGQTVYERTPMR